MEYSNKPVPNQPWRRYFKNLVKNYTRSKNLGTSQHIPELRELGILSTLYELELFLQLTQKEKYFFAKASIKIGKAAKKKNAFVQLFDFIKISRIGYCYYHIHNQQLMTYCQLRHEDKNFDYKKEQIEITQLHKIPFVVLSEATFMWRGHKISKITPFVVN